MNLGSVWFKVVEIVFVADISSSNHEPTIHNLAKTLTSYDSFLVSFEFVNFYRQNEGTLDRFS